MSHPDVAPDEDDEGFPLPDDGGALDFAGLVEVTADGRVPAPPSARRVTSSSCPWEEDNEGIVAESNDILTAAPDASIGEGRDTQPVAVPSA